MFRCAYLFGETNESIFCNQVTKTTSSNNTNGSSTNFSGVSAVHTRASCYTGTSSAHVSKNASERQIDTTVTFTVVIVGIEQNEEFQESRIHYTLAGIKSLLKIGGGGGGSLTREGGFRNPWNPPLATPLQNVCLRSALRSLSLYGNSLFCDLLRLFAIYDRLRSSAIIWKPPLVCIMWSNYPGAYVVGAAFLFLGSSPFL